MPRIYATPEDLTDWTGKPAPANATSLLRSASVLVEDATLTAIYTVDRDGKPTQPAIRQAFLEATCEQAGFWADNDLDPAKGARSTQAQRLVTTKAISGASISYDANDAARTKQAKIDALDQLNANALRILRNAQLVTTAVQS